MAQYTLKVLPMLRALEEGLLVGPVHHLKVLVAPLWLQGRGITILQLQSVIRQQIVTPTLRTQKTSDCRLSKASNSFDLESIRICLNICHDEVRDDQTKLQIPFKLAGI